METSTLFLVRVWRQPRRGGTSFRASVRAVDVEQERVFTRAADLARFLDGASTASTQQPALQTPPNAHPRSAA